MHRVRVPRGLRGPSGEAEERAWLRLARSENVGPATFFALIERFGTAEAAVEALPRLTQPPRRKPAVLASPAAVERELAAAQRLGARFVCFGSADYPPRLAEIHAPPPVIALRGSSSLMMRRPIAVVGSRKASAAGRTMARNLAAAFAEAGRAVVSGLALGIDAEAHTAALEGGTVAVVAGGIDRPTPEAHRDLAEAIAEHGAVVSEMPLGWMPLARDYPRRNRLIAGLSEGVVVVEAAVRSGSLHTARYALDENREVFAVPGSPLDPRAAGCLALLRAGAGLVVEASDVLDALAAVAPSGWTQPAPPPSTREAPRGAASRGIPSRTPAGLGTSARPSADHDASAAPPADEEAAAGAVRNALSVVPVSVDELVRVTGLSASAVHAALVDLELSGEAHREADGRMRAASGEA